MRATAGTPAILRVANIAAATSGGIIGNGVADTARETALVVIDEATPKPIVRTISAVCAILRPRLRNARSRY